ncbi:outer membrane cobalamin receptor protein [Belliella baltica DSM 15883]|uniref:Outer membrane cobalamin receptor protein n=1 Tax=Belliella baltica (strain DSM 15883 / CIP 108006 / LMG 21964 / BA134) TaxID=866536 RepID=I3ZAR9_BELBD|nr:TonB-dependent receptor [Belliella baltica]AFL86337.1 outer membrane cobalamin receptor protein [Belliella baltica DSM 15883]
MKKRLLLPTLMIISFIAKGNQDTTLVDLGEVIIKENRIEIPFNKISRNISIISRKDIETTPARSLQEVLAFTPGVDVRQRGVSGVQGDVGIRGGGFEQTLMLINGIKMTDPQTGHHIMNIPVPLQAIQRVEVMKGPASRIYGQNAYAGAINIVTMLPETQGLNIQAYGGDFGMKGISAVSSLPINLPFGKYKQTLSFSHDASSGYWYNSDYKVSNIFYEGGLDLNDRNELRTMIGYTDRTFGANGFYTNSFPDQWESIQTFLASLSHTYNHENIYLQTRAYWRRNTDEFRLRRNEPAFFTNNHITDVLALEFNGRYESKFGTSGFGIEGRNEQIESSNLGNRERSFLGIFAEHRVEFWNDFDFRAGVYSNYYNEYGWKHFPGAELGYQISNNSRVYTNYGASYRIPSFNDLYYEDPSNFSNPNLVPEEAQSFEVGYKFNKQGFRFELVYFNRYTENLIDWSREPSDIVPNPNRWTPRNISEVTFQGIETGAQYALNLGGKKFKLKEVSLSYNFIDASLNQAAGVESRTSLTALRHQAIAGVQSEFFTNLELNLKTRYIERMSLDPYFLMDIRVDYNRLKAFGIFAEASNVTNADYVEAGFVQMPGRWFRAGIAINLQQ